MTTHDPKARSKSGRFLWTRNQVREAIEAEATTWKGIVEGMQAEIEQLNADLEEARNVIRSVLKHGRALDKALDGWLASKAEQPETAPPADPALAAKEAPDPAAPSPVEAVDELEARPAPVLRQQDDDDTEGATAEIPPLLRCGPILHHADGSASIVLALASGVEASWQVDDGEWQPLQPDASSVLVWRNQHRARFVMFDVRRGDQRTREMVRVESLPEHETRKLSDGRGL